MDPFCGGDTELREPSPYSLASRGGVGWLSSALWENREPCHLTTFTPAVPASKLPEMKILQILHNYRKKETHDVCFIIYIARFIGF